MAWLTKIQMQPIVSIFHKQAFTHSSEVPQVRVTMGHPWLAIVWMGVIATGTSQLISDFLASPCLGP